MNNETREVPIYDLTPTGPRLALVLTATSCCWCKPVDLTDANRCRGCGHQWVFEKPGRCKDHPAYEPQNCPGCGTSRVIGGTR